MSGRPFVVLALAAQRSSRPRDAAQDLRPLLGVLPVAAACGADLARPPAVTTRLAHAQGAQSAKPLSPFQSTDPRVVQRQPGPPRAAGVAAPPGMPVHQREADQVLPAAETNTAGPGATGCNTSNPAALVMAYEEPR